MLLSLATSASHKRLRWLHHLGHAVDGRVGSERMLRSFRVPVALPSELPKCLLVLYR